MRAKKNTPTIAVDAMELLRLAALCDPGISDPSSMRSITHDDRKRIAGILTTVASDLLDSAKRAAHRPATREKSFWAAVAIALRPADETIEAAKARIRQRLRMSQEAMRRAWLNHRSAALTMVQASSNEDGLRIVVDRQLRRCIKLR